MTGSFEWVFLTSQPCARRFHDDEKWRRAGHCVTEHSATYAPLRKSGRLSGCGVPFVRGTPRLPHHCSKRAFPLFCNLTIVWQEKKNNYKKENYDRLRN
ncbi:hypothetical protein CEXT_809791 [Caerostris extrusa]|uniref:Uncharacterized protein n=1 Tax=Caerostris extrusa TaxID=172846 RepID=A0AAV4WWX4_CAEEX|nr:hypothetical protein CEXT_809791 [Caerostris extrusa]